MRKRKTFPPELHIKIFKEERKMKASIIKKLMMGALTASLVMAPAMSVFAATTTTTTKADTTTEVEEIVAESTSGEVTTVAEIPSTSSVAGVTSTVSGVYLATSVSGTAITSAVSSIAQGYGLTGSEKPYAKFSNMDPKKSNLAKQSIDMAAASQGAVVGPMLNIELGKMSGGKYSLLPSDGAAIRLSVGLPKSFAQADKTFAVICVRAGGAVSILPDVDSNPNTVTFDTTGGAGAYALIKY